MAKTQPGLSMSRALLHETITATDEKGKPVKGEDGKPITFEGGYLIPDDKLTDLEHVERDYGFTFGVPEVHESAGGAKGLAVACTNQDCARVNRLVQLHDDTVLPVNCGECGRLLYCAHPDTLPVTHHEGDLAHPRRVTREVCVVCQTEVSRKVEDLPAISIEHVPLHLFAGLDLDAAATAAQDSLRAAKAAEGME